MAELPDAQVLAGGTDLLVDINTGIRQARHVISLREISELAVIEDTGEKISIGAACTAEEIASSPLVQRHFPEIVEMVPLFASPQVRTRATVGGNICGAVACSDFPVILIALGAEIELVSQNGGRMVLLKDFFVGNRKTIRRGDEILIRIMIPKKRSTSAACYLKFQRRASNSLAVASVGAFLDLKDGTCREARIVLGAVAPVPLLAEKASAALRGKCVTEEAINETAGLAREEARPITDVRGTEEFRRELVYVLTRRAIQQVVEKIEGKPRA